MKRLIVILFLVQCIASCGLAAGPTVDILSVPGIILNSYFADFNNDHKSEALVFFLDESGAEPARKCAIFSQEKGRFKSQTDQLFEIAPTATCFDVGNLNDDESAELGFIVDDGVIAYQYANGVMTRLKEPILKANTMFNGSFAEDIVHWDFIWDSDTLHREAIIFLTTNNGFDIYARSGKKYRLVQTLACSHRASVRGRAAYDNYRSIGFQFECSMPSVKFADYNGDKLPDIYIMDNRLVYIYKRNFDGSYSAEPVEIFGRGILDQNEKRLPQTSVSYDIFDLNNDGLADIIATKNSSDMASFNTSIQIFRGKQMAGYNSKPNDEFTMTNGATSPYIYDLNHDGRLDLLLPSLKLGVMTSLKVLILKEVEISLKAYIQQATDEYPDKPNFEKSAAYEVAFNQYVDYGGILSLEGDFDADGYNDLLAHNGSGHFKIFRGSSDKIFDSDVWFEFDIPRPDGINAIDLNGDSRSEIVAYYLIDIDNRKSVRIVWSQL